MQTYKNIQYTHTTEKLSPYIEWYFNNIEFVISCLFSDGLNTDKFTISIQVQVILVHNYPTFKDNIVVHIKDTKEEHVVTSLWDARDILKSYDIDLPYNVQTKPKTSYETPKVQIRYIGKKCYYTHNVEIQLHPNIDLSNFDIVKELNNILDEYYAILSNMSNCEHFIDLFLYTMDCHKLLINICYNNEFSYSIAFSSAKNFCIFEKFPELVKYLQINYPDEYCIIPSKVAVQQDVIIPPSDDNIINNDSLLE